MIYILIGNVEWHVTVW